ncbi:hypothetical protein D9M71_234610 [compost metagenome]
MIAGQQVQAQLALAQPTVQEGVDAFLPVVAKQGVRLRDQLAGRQEQVQCGLGVLEQGNIQVDAQHRHGRLAGIAQHGAQGADLLAVPVEFFVGADVPFDDFFAEHVLERGIVADLAFGEVVGDVVDLLRAQVMQHHFGVGKKQGGDGIGNRPVIVQGGIAVGWAHGNSPGGVSALGTGRWECAAIAGLRHSAPRDCSRRRGDSISALRPNARRCSGSGRP